MSTILQLIAGLLLLSEVCARIFQETPFTAYYYLCRPFFVPMPMTIAMAITLIETITGTLLIYHGILTLIH